MRWRKTSSARMTEALLDEFENLRPSGRQLLGRARGAGGERVLDVRLAQDALLAPTAGVAAAVAAGRHLGARAEHGVQDLVAVPQRPGVVDAEAAALRPGPPVSLSSRFHRYRTGYISSFISTSGTMLETCVVMPEPSRPSPVGCAPAPISPPSMLNRTKYSPVSVRVPAEMPPVHESAQMPWVRPRSSASALRSTRG